jgi:hypothetical protein
VERRLLVSGNVIEASYDTWNFSYEFRANNSSYVSFHLQVKLL